MRDVIQSWLNDCLAVKFKENIGMQLSDGVILAKLLKHYSIVDEKVIRHILPSDNPVVCENNLHQLCVWFRLLGIHMTDEGIANIARGKTTAILALLYQLYVALHDKKNLAANFDNEKLKAVGFKAPTCKMIRQQHNILLHSDNELDKDNCPDIFSYAEETEEELEEKIPTKMCENKGISPDTTIVKGNIYDKMRREDIWFVRNQLQTIPQYVLVDKKKRLSPKYKALSENIISINEDHLEHRQEFDQLEVEKKIPDSSTVEPLGSNLEAVEQTEHQDFRKLISQNMLRQSDYEKQLAFNRFQATYENEVNQNKFKELTTKQNQESGYETFFSTCKTSEEEIAFQLEGIKKMELHRKLYDQKIRKRNIRRFEMCQQIVKDIIEFSIKVVDHGKENITLELISKWKHMQEEGEPLLESENTSEKDIPIVQIDKPVVITLNDYDFDEYNHLVGDWFIAAGLDVSYDDQPILSHIVYRLQNCRLPKAVPIEPATLPRYMITAVLNCNMDELTTVKLATLLTKSKICMVDTKTAIQFCIERYKIEADIKPPETVNKKSPPKSKEGTAKTGKTAESKKNSPKSKAKEPVITFKEEEVQTSDSLLDNIIAKPEVLSDPAQLGMHFYNSNISEHIPTTTIVDALIEFLKCQKDIKGWVLLNFPSNLKEAYVLEKVLTGKDYANEFCQHVNERVESLISEQEQDEQTTEFEIKRSRLVQYPVQNEHFFKTYFTSFINFIKNDSNAATKEQYSESGNAEEYEDMEENEEETIIDLNYIYKNQGVLLKLYYDNMDFKMLQDLARAILMVDNVNRIPSNELFGEEVMQYYKGTDMSSKPSTAKTAKTPLNKKTPKAKDELSLAKEFLDKLLSSMKPSKTDELDAIEEHDVEELELEEQEENIGEVEVNAVPGNDDWSFADFPLGKKNAVALANSWEYLEDKYINAVEKALCEIKNNQVLIDYYENFVIKSLNLDNYQSNCSNVETIVKEFVCRFNNFLGDSQLDKTQLTSDILNLEMRLWRISKERRNEAEKNRKELIDKNWTAYAMVDISKAYLSLMEAEVDRSNSTITILCSYYCTMCGGIPITEEVPLLKLANYNTLCCDKSNIKMTISKMLADKHEMSQENPVCLFLQNIVSKYNSEISQNQLKFQYLVELYMEHTLNTILELRQETNYEIKPDHRFKEGSISEQMCEDFEPGEEEEEASENTQIDITALFQTNDNEIKNMFLEWNHAIKCELDRLAWRIRIINEKAISALDNLEKSMTEVFHNIHNDIITSYLNENKCIDELCRIFQAALNDRTQVNEEVTVVKNCVYIEKKYDDMVIVTSIDKLLEDIKDYCFTIEQLDAILKRLKGLELNSITNSRAFQYIIEDMVYEEDSEYTKNLFPKLWSNLNANKFSQIWKTVFGNTNQLYWKHFLLYCLDIEFPEMEDIVSYKQLFISYDKDNNGTISYDDFMKIILWFEENTRGNTERQTYYQHVKEFLFFIFKVDESGMDYNDFFISFSKGSNSSIGFGKALAYLSGKCTIISEQSDYLEDILIEYNEMLSKMVREILDEIIFNTFNDFFGVKIEEILEEQIANIQGDIPTVSLLEDMKKSGQIKKTKSLVGRELYYGEIEEEEIEGHEFVIKSMIDKGSQTVPLDELMHDVYITKQKQFNWTKRAKVDTVNYLLETYVYPILELNNDDTFSATRIKQDINDMLSTLENDGLVSVDSIMKETPMQNLFLCTHMFEIFSFPSLVQNCEGNCFY